MLRACLHIRFSAYVGCFLRVPACVSAMAHVSMRSLKDPASHLLLNVTSKFFVYSNARLFSFVFHFCFFFS